MPKGHFVIAVVLGIILLACFLWRAKRNPTDSIRRFTYLSIAQLVFSITLGVALAINAQDTISGLPIFWVMVIVNIIDAITKLRRAAKMAKTSANEAPRA